jgi:hypothetical protein
MMRAGWNECPPPEDGDCRKLVTLERDGMIWVGIRAFSGRRWINNGQSETANVIAWRDLPPPAYSDGLMVPMSGPTLPEGPL